MTGADRGLWDRWDEVDRLLDEALDLPEPERTAYVERQAADDLRLSSVVLRLIGRLERDTGRLTRPSRALVREAFAPENEPPGMADLAPGTSAGRYVIVGRRGRGGMATVYEAERTDGVYQQRVALKVLRRGLDTDDLIRRFLTERQILSTLTHPGIARLLDGGALPDGRPFLVMELVDGLPITAFADERRLDLRARLELFLEVADAVHAAHRRLVVHRDIKPSNILVDDEGRAKLLDFGIAKLLGPDADHATATERVLTPDYASPEQMRGDPITTGTDVYQLGLLLRELLTGLPPRRSGPAVPDQPTRPSRAARESREGVPVPEARAAARQSTPDRLASALTGDLDVIVATALRPDPDERYGSADELAADVRRHLEGRPVVAHPESLAYRARKFIGRHPLFLPGAAAALVAVVGFMVVITLQNQRLERERDAADLASQRAIATQDFLVDLL
jgi:serine/threonine-protein kinase